MTEKIFEPIIFLIANVPDKALAVFIERSRFDTRGIVTVGHSVKKSVTVLVLLFLVSLENPLHLLLGKIKAVEEIGGVGAESEVCLNYLVGKRRRITNVKVSVTRFLNVFIPDFIHNRKIIVALCVYLLCGIKLAVFLAGFIV